MMKQYNLTYVFSNKPTSWKQSVCTFGNTWFNTFKADLEFQPAYPRRITSACEIHQKDWNFKCYSYVPQSLACDTDKSESCPLARKKICERERITNRARVDVSESGSPSTIAEAVLNDWWTEEDDLRSSWSNHWLLLVRLKSVFYQ